MIWPKDVARQDVVDVEDPNRTQPTWIAKRQTTSSWTTGGLAGSPADEAMSHTLLLREEYIRQLAAGYQPAHKFKESVTAEN